MTERVIVAPLMLTSNTTPTSIVRSFFPFDFEKGGAVIDQLEGVNIPALNEKIQKYAKASPAAGNNKLLTSGPFPSPLPANKYCSSNNITNYPITLTGQTQQPSLVAINERSSLRPAAEAHHTYPGQDLNDHDLPRKRKTPDNGMHD